MSALKDFFFKTASQYYIAGRYAAFAWLNPTVANLFHHAIEMYLKGGLSEVQTLDQLKKFGHHLPRLWEAFKKEVNGPTLDKFDRVIAGLHSFEELRYPDSVVEKGMQSIIGITKSTVETQTSGQASQVAQYELCVQEIDELIAAIFAAAKRNPAAYLRFSDQAKLFLKKANVETSLTEHLKD